MITIENRGMLYRAGTLLPAAPTSQEAAEGRKKTMTYGILAAHNTAPSMQELHLRFDAMASHDITYVGIIQTARASGLEAFPLPYVLTNCHNSLCAVGGTINEDDHAFGLSAARRYGGEFVPAHQAVIHSYMRERYAAPGKMLLGSDSHTRYGAYGTLAIGEGGPELVKQLLNRTYDLSYPRVVGVYLTGSPRPGVGPQDVALALIAATFDAGTVKNSVMEFFGPGIAALSMDYRNGIDVMTTETSCLSSVWQTDGVVEESLRVHLRGGEYRCLQPGEGAYYDALIRLDLGRVEPMIALPFHPSNAMPIRVFNENAEELLAGVEQDAARLLGGKPASLRKKLRGGHFYADQGVIAGCSGGTYQNLLRTAQLLDGQVPGCGGFSLSCYPASQPVLLELMRRGALEKLVSAGVSVRSAFCGPCFGAGDVPADGGFSIRHCTRNFPNREGSRPADGQTAFVALMDARSIAASALNGGAITPATELAQAVQEDARTDYRFDPAPYRRVYYGVGKPDRAQPLVFGPNIADWPQQPPLPEDLLLTVASAIYDPVTTTDELIPSGETSSYRSNPLRLSQFALSRKDPAYVARAQAALEQERARREGRLTLAGLDLRKTGLGSCIMAIRPGDGSAREQAASCQRVLGGVANLCRDYATRRYRSNVINWGMLPFTVENIEHYGIAPGDRIYIPGIRALLRGEGEAAEATLWQNGRTTPLRLHLRGLSRQERDIILAGCLINYYRAQEG